MNKYFIGFGVFLDTLFSTLNISTRIDRSALYGSRMHDPILFRDLISIHAVKIIFLIANKRRCSRLESR